jgi:hypothetical protein
MTDNITLPRAVLWRVVYEFAEGRQGRELTDAISAIAAALAEPEQKSAFQVDAERYRWLRGEVQGPHTPLAQVVWKRNNIRESGDWTNLSDGQTLDEAIDAALAEPVHPGYVIGSHWLETAYSRIAAGESEAKVLTEVLGARGWARREPATDEQVVEADENHEPSWLDYRDGWRDAERFHGIRTGDKT